MAPSSKQTTTCSLERTAIWQISTRTDISICSARDWTLLTQGHLGNLLEIHHGNPNGTFTIAPVYSKSYSSADFISPFAARDLNGDGYPDILALSADGLVIFFGEPGMQFSAPVHYAFYNPESFDEDQGDPSLIADYNLDGNLDLAMPGVNGIYITYGRPDGTFDALPVIRPGLRRLATTSSLTSMKTEPQTSSLRVRAGLQLSLGKGNGTFARLSRFRLSGSSPNYSSEVLRGCSRGTSTETSIRMSSHSDSPRPTEVSLVSYFWGVETVRFRILSRLRTLTS